MTIELPDYLPTITGEWAANAVTAMDEDICDELRVHGKAIPLKLLLGDKAATVSIFLQLLAALGHPVAGKPSDDPDSIPF